MATESWIMALMPSGERTEEDQVEDGLAVFEGTQVEAEGQKKNEEVVEGGGLVSGRRAP